MLIYSVNYGKYRNASIIYCQNKQSIAVLYCKNSLFCIKTIIPLASLTEYRLKDFDHKVPINAKKERRRRSFFRGYRSCIIQINIKSGASLTRILHMVPMFITTLSQTRMKSRFLAADEYISPKKSNSVGASWLKPSRKIAHLRLSSPPYIMEAQRRQAR